MPNINELRSALAVLNKRFSFDRVFGIVVILLGVVLGSPLMLFFGSGICLLAAWDSIRVRQAEKLIAQHEENHPSAE